MSVYSSIPCWPIWYPSILCRPRVPYVVSAYSSVWCWPTLFLYGVGLQRRIVSSYGAISLKFRMASAYNAIIVLTHSAVYHAIMFRPVDRNVVLMVSSYVPYGVILQPPVVSAYSSVWCRATVPYCVVLWCHNYRINLYFCMVLSYSAVWCPPIVPYGIGL